MITTPVDDFVRAYADGGVIRAHLPGHKGRGEGPERWDITEMTGADSLYEADGIILESEENAARLFGSGLTCYSAEGSSLSIRAMLLLALRRAQRPGERPWLLAGRNAHRTLLSAAALLDFDIRWISNAECGMRSAESDHVIGSNNSEFRIPNSEFGCGLLSSSMNVSALDEALSRAETLPFAVYLTSPDYLGGVVDIRAAAEICHAHGVILLVDNAHGAYLRFLPESRHPLDLGADMCADSAHKTLPALTGAGYLHVSKRLADITRADVKAAMSVFASTSPSYLILASLDRCNRLLEREFPGQLATFARRMDLMKEHLEEAGVVLTGDEPIKLTIRATRAADGHMIQRLLQERGIECEMADPDFVTLMLAPCQLDQMDTIERPLLDTAGHWAGQPVRIPPALPSPGERVMTIREAMLSPQETLPLSQCEGRVLASDTTGCPPAVPIAVCGERLTEETIELCRYYGLKTLRVAKLR